MLNRWNYSDHLLKFLTAAAGKNLIQAERLSGSRVRVRLNVDGHPLDFRILAFAVGGGGRNITGERRVEITATYHASQLDRLGGVVDVVIGIERDNGFLVGIDPRRLEHGGDTHNASTFVYTRHFQRLSFESLATFENNRQQLFQRENQIYFKPEFIFSYLKEISVLHSSGLRQTPVVGFNEAIIDRVPEFEASGSQQTLTYEQQVELALKRMQIGRLGEGLVFEREKKSLTQAGKPTLADKVEWISQKKPYVGYDVGSLFEDGSQHLIEVKSSVGNLKAFHMSKNEIKVAKYKGKKYSIICVSNVFGNPSFQTYNDVSARMTDGSLLFDAESFIVKIA